MPLHDFKSIVESSCDRKMRALPCLSEEFSRDEPRNGTWAKCKGHDEAKGGHDDKVADPVAFQRQRHCDQDGENNDAGQTSQMQ